MKTRMISDLYRRKSNAFWSLLDQGLVSASSFIINILLAKYLGLKEFSTFAIIQSYVLYFALIQNCFVSTPMLTDIPSAIDNTQKRNLTLGYLSYGHVLAIISATGLLVIAVIFEQVFENLALGFAALPAAAYAGCLQMQDCVRKAFYAEQRRAESFVINFIYLAPTVAAIYFLEISNALSINNFLYASMSCAVLSCMTGMRIYGAKVRVSGLQEVAKMSIKKGRHFFVASQFQWIASSGLVLFAASYLGPTAAGAFRAINNLLGPVNVAFQWLDNFLPVAGAKKYVAEGPISLDRYLRKSLLWGSLFIIILIIPLAIYSKNIVVIFFGQDFERYAHLIQIFCIYYWLGYIYRIKSYQLRILQREKILTIGSFCWSVFSVAPAIFLIPVLSDSGLVISMVIGEATALAYIFWRANKND
ncbi:lipopolysaccharide biosynthesis protein [Pseudacidovorax intermedius]|nr:lipopolysaccharide biosynthesis protein [Pseudacidovorax intermedius]